MNPENVKIQKWLRALIKNGPYDMEEMSSRCGASQEAIMAVTNGMRPMTLSGFVKTCRIYDLDPGETLNQIFQEQ